MFGAAAGTSRITPITARRPARPRAALRALAAVFAAGAVLVLVVLHLGLHINFTPSLPRGLYRAVGGPPVRGSIVIACVPPGIAPLALERRYLWRGDCPGGVVPVGKVVLGAPGDTIALAAAGLSVNGQAVPNSRAVPRDSRGRPMPHYPYGTHVLGPGEVWLFSPFHPLSFDSRYFGPVPSAGVRSRLVPVWTTGPVVPRPGGSRGTPAIGDR